MCTPVEIPDAAQEVFGNYLDNITISPIAGRHRVVLSLHDAVRHIMKRASKAI